MVEDACASGVGGAVADWFPSPGWDARAAGRCRREWA